MPISSHMHRGVDYTFHFEPNPSRCIAFGDATPHVGMSFDANHITLSGAHAQTQLTGTDHNQAGTYTAGDHNATLTFYHKVPNAGWETISASSLAKRQLKDGEKVLILYGTYTADQVRALQAGVPLAKEYADVHPGAT
jgi:hypothetical protein